MASDFDPVKFRDGMRKVCENLNAQIALMQDTVNKIRLRRSPEMIDVGSRWRYAQEVKRQRLLGRTFVRAEAARVRGELRARGLNIPER